MVVENIPSIFSVFEGYSTILLRTGNKHEIFSVVEDISNILTPSAGDIIDESALSSSSSVGIFKFFSLFNWFSSGYFIDKNVVRCHDIQDSLNTSFGGQLSS